MIELIIFKELLKSVPIKRQVWVTFDNGEKYHVELICPQKACIIKQMLEDQYLKDKGKPAKATHIVVF